MSTNPADNYLRVKVMTATPEQLQMMLYDGALRFCEQARSALEKKNYEQSYGLISKVQKILMEMSCTLKHDLAPELCSRLSALYTYAYRKLIEANVRHDLPPLDEAISVLRYQRQTWSMLLEQLGRTRATAAAQRLDLPAPSERMEASISVHG